MNTQTHMLLAITLLLPLAPVLDKRTNNGATQKAASVNVIQMTLAVLVGALLPDASLFVMFFIAKAQGVADSVIWSEWYFSQTWQQIGAVFNSIPLFAGIGMTAYAIRSHQLSLSTKMAKVNALIILMSLAALLHCITDMPLHHDDGHPHFWPFSSWIYSSPVSYWDPSHYGNQWSFFELLVAAVLIALLWRRHKNRWSHAVLTFTALSYGAVAFFWFATFG